MQIGSRGESARIIYYIIVVYFNFLKEKIINYFDF